LTPLPADAGGQSRQIERGETMANRRRMRGSSRDGRRAQRSDYFGTARQPASRLYLTILTTFVVAVLGPPSAMASVWCKTPAGTIVVRHGCAGYDALTCKECLADETRIDAGMLQQALQCPPDAMKVGPTCIDIYEASIWQIPASNTALIEKVLLGEASLADLSGVATAPGPLYGQFPENGNWTDPTVMAVSVPGVLPAVGFTWFQAEQACARAGKRLLTNQEWQRAAAGTSDPGDADDGATTCATNSTLALTGARPNCVSVWGIHDMVGNAREWVADWLDLDVANAKGVPNCTLWPGGFGADSSCVGGPGGGGRASLPAALQRGGSYFDTNGGGVFAVLATFTPDEAQDGVGFRCAR